MPVDPFRLRTLKALTDALKTISPENGYTSDFSDVEVDGAPNIERVYRGRMMFGAGDDPDDLISILEHPKALDVAQSQGSSASSGQWDLLIQGFLKDDPTHPTDRAHIASADVLKCLSAEKVRGEGFDILGLGGICPCVGSMEIGQPVVRPGDGEVSTQSFFLISVTLGLVEDLANPFA
jgi:hypothetical protein